MASTFTAMSSISSLAAPCSRAVDKKLSNSSEKLSSLASISSSSLGGRRQNMVLQRRCSPKIRAMAKELYFNKDGSAIKKLQVRFCMSVGFASSWIEVLECFAVANAFYLLISDWC